MPALIESFGAAWGSYGMVFREAFVTPARRKQAGMERRINCSIDLPPFEE